MLCLSRTFSPRKEQDVTLSGNFSPLLLAPICSALLFLGQYFGRDDLYMNGVKNISLAEILTNTRGFVAVVTNLAGNYM